MSAEEAAQGLVALDPDVRHAFRDADAVNRALRGLIQIEPAPIDLPAATVAHARDLLTDLQTANIDRTKFDPRMKLTDETLQSGANHIRPYGEPLDLTPVEFRTTAEGNTAVFRVRFAAETLTWAVRVDRQGLINGFDLRHNARKHIYQIVTRLIEGY
jgi:hypothetical protein